MHDAGMYVDAHAHIVHPQFAGEEDAVADRAAAAGLDFVIVNGLEPKSNREVLALCERHDHLVAALGIYPLDAICNAIGPHNWAHDFEPPTRFDVDAEIDWIAEHAHEAVAIGECGLDQHWVKDQAAEQERVLRRLCEVAIRADKPMILHSRRAETRTFEVLQEMGVERADFHCYCGKLKLAKRIAAAGYFLSIPPVIERAESFQILARELPASQLLTETDCPYMGPDRGERNEPANVVRGIAAMAKARDVTADEMAQTVRANFKRLFRI